MRSGVITEFYTKLYVSRLTTKRVVAERHSRDVESAEDTLALGSFHFPGENIALCLSDRQGTGEPEPSKH